MTDARYPERWLTDRRIQRLSDSHFRSFVTSLVWSVSNRSDGVIEPLDLALIPNFTRDAVRALVDAGLWTSLENDEGWRIAEFAETQTSRSELDALAAVRTREREKKARQRAAAKAQPTSSDGDVPRTVPGTSPRDVPPDYTGKDRPGKDRPGQATKVTTLPGVCIRCGERPASGDPQDPTACRPCADEMADAAADLHNDWETA